MILSWLYFTFVGRECPPAMGIPIPGVFVAVYRNLQSETTRQKYNVRHVQLYFAKKSIKHVHRCIYFKLLIMMNCWMIKLVIQVTLSAPININFAVIVSDNNKAIRGTWRSFCTTNLKADQTFISYFVVLFVLSQHVGLLQTWTLILDMYLFTQ